MMKPAEPIELTYENRLRQIFSTRELLPILEAIRETELPDQWLAGGAVRNTVWKHLYGDECQLGIKDFDIAFFDKDAGREREAVAREALQAAFPDRKFDVKNQASFGVWREGKFTFTSSEDGISNWLHTATAVGVRLNDSHEIEIFQPYGLNDLFQGIIRATPNQIDDPAAAAKKDEFLRKCPRLKVAK
jgi:uncharacterized protein